MKKYLKISVMTITLNRKEMLERAILSVLEQEYPNFEHIIIDGGSTDGTVEMLKKYRHLKWVSEPDNGQAEAMNKGISRLNGDIFAWLNSDDYYTKGTFHKVNELFLQYNDISMLYGRCNIVTYDGSRIGRTNYHKFNFRRIILGFNNINTPAVFIRAQVFNKIGFFDTSLKATYDVDMFIRIGSLFKIMAFPNLFSNLRLHKDSGLISTKHHISEVAELRNRYWIKRSIFDYLVFTYYYFSNYFYNKLKFDRFEKAVLINAR